jgi:cell division protein FtsL
MTEETKVEQPTPESAQQESAELTINDLNAMKTIIDIASSRGAFKPNEMVAVGQTYTKLSAFLESVAKTAKPGA